MGKITGVYLETTAHSSLDGPALMQAETQLDLIIFHPLVQFLVLPVIQDLEVRVQFDDRLDDPDQCDIRQIVHVKHVLQLHSVVFVYIAEFIRESPH